jgi:hypothetical protein
MRNNNDKQTNTTSVLHLEHLNQKKEEKEKRDGFHSRVCTYES